MTGILDTLVDNGIQLIPALFTYAMPNGLADGHWMRMLALHGSMTVEGYCL